MFQALLAFVLGESYLMNKYAVIFKILTYYA